MTYRQFIKAVRNDVDFLERMVRDSQVINFNDEMGEDDTFLDVYRDGVKELMDNATGVHGHTVEVRA